MGPEIKLTDKDMAQACLDTYDPNTQWLKRTGERHGVYLCARLQMDTLTLAFRGSTTPEDWLRDFIAIPISTSLGIVHSGFYFGAKAAIEDIGNLIKVYSDRLVLTGHSLGAAEAMISAGLLIKSGITPRAVITFGCPRPGFYELSKLLIDSGAVIRCYRNGDDPVSLVPRLLPSWLKPVADTLMDIPPDANDREPLHCHHMPLYFAGTPARPVTSRGDWTP